MGQQSAAVNDGSSCHVSARTDLDDVGGGPAAADTSSGFGTDPPSMIESSAASERAKT
jgi:hypothetical protein